MLPNCIHTTCVFTARHWVHFRNPSPNLDPANLYSATKWSGGEQVGLENTKTTACGTRLNTYTFSDLNWFANRDNGDVFIPPLSFHLGCWRQSGESPTTTKKLKLRKLKIPLGYQFYAHATRAITLYKPTKWSTTITSAGEEIFFGPYISLCTTSSSTLGGHRRKCQGKKFHMCREELRKDKKGENWVTGHLWHSSICCKGRWDL